MADFLVVLSSPSASVAAESRFRLALELERALKSQEPTSTHQGAGYYAASFARRDATGGPIAVDPLTGSWLLASGTWFHDRDFASGAESRLLARYLEAGPAALAREIDGFFVVVVWDARIREAFVITDAVGCHHAFTRYETGVAMLSGSSLVLAGLGDGRTHEDLDPLGVQELIRTGCPHEGRTVHRGVRRLSGGRVHRFRDGVLAGVTQHWRPSYAPPDRLDGPEAADAFHASLMEAGRRIAKVEPRILADLTGGYDSRAIAAAFLSAGVPFATTVTGMPGSDDVVAAARVAAVAGLDHRWIPMKPAASFADVGRMLPFTDGGFDMVEYAQIFSVQNAFAREFGASVHGSSGEIARGRFWMHLLPHIGAKGPMDARPLVSSRFRDSRADSSLFPPAGRLDLHRHFLELIARETADLADLPNTLQIDAVFLAFRMSNWQGRVASSTDRLRRCIAPFLLRSVLDTMLSMTIRTRYRSRVVREMLARHQPALARVPMGRGYPPMPFRLNTALSFWPLPVYYAKRIVTKAARMAGLRPSNRSTAGIPPSARLALWKEEPVRELLRPEAMRSSALLAPERLETFLLASRGQDFAFEGAWNRLLSLETMLARLSDARRSIARFALDGAPPRTPIGSPAARTSRIPPSIDHTFV